MINREWMFLRAKLMFTGYLSLSMVSLTKDKNAVKYNRTVHTHATWNLSLVYIVALNKHIQYG